MSSRWKVAGRLLLALLAIVFLAGPRVGLADDSKHIVPVPSSGPLANRTIYRNSYALIVGINRYEHLPQTSWLNYAVDDATDLRDLLIKSYGFPAENITVLTDQNATKENIEDALSDLADQSKVDTDDRILIFFSGHGQTVPTAEGGDQGFLIPYDADIDLDHVTNPGPYLRTCVQMNTIWTYLDSSPAKHCLVLADACYSGLLAKARSIGDVKQEVLEQMASLRAMQVMTAGTKGQPCREFSQYGHGAFTYKLLEHLRADADKPGAVITATDLYTQVASGVMDITNGEQIPQLASREGAEGDFLFITTPPQPVPPLALPAPPTIGQPPPTPVAPTPAAPSAGTDDADLKAAQSSYTSGDYDGAISHYTAALKSSPNDSTALYGRALSYGHKQDWENAITDYTAAIAAEPDNANAYYNRGLMYIDKGTYDKALDDLNKYIGMVPSDADGFVERGVIEDDQQDYKDGIADDTKAISLKSDDSIAYYNRGADEDRLSETDQAISDLTVYIGFAPNDPDGYYWRGHTYADAGQYDKAVTEYTRALGVKSDYSAGLAGRALAYYHLNEDDQALSDFNAAIALDPDDTNAYYNRGLVEDDQKNYKASVTDYTKYIAAVPGDADGYYRRALAYNNDLQYDKAIADYKKSLSIKPDAGREGSLGWCQYRAGHLQDAIQTDLAALQTDASQTWIRFDLGLAYLAAGSKDKAAETYKDALRTASQQEINSGIDDLQNYQKTSGSPAASAELTLLKAAKPVTAPAGQ